MSLLNLTVGLLVGFAVGLTSQGGGSLLTTALLLTGVPPSLAVGSNVLVASFVKFFGGGAYALRRYVHWPTVLHLTLGSLPGAALGVIVLNQLPDTVLNALLMHCLGWVLMLAGLGNVTRRWRSVSALRESPPAVQWTILLGFAIGVLVSLTSTGSGSLLLAILAAFYPLRAQALVGTNLAHAFFLTSTAAACHALSGRVDLELTMTLIGGGLPGVLLGARLAWHVPERVLRFGLFAFLTALGCYLAFA